MPNSKAINASKFFGKDRYEHYLNELLTENTIGGQKLSKQELKEGFSKRKNKISFEQFIDKIVSTKTAKSSVAFSGKSPPPSPSASGGNGLRKGSLIRSSSNQIQKYIGISQKTGEGVEENISAIVKSVISIADIVVKQKKISDDASAYEKRKSEQEKRGLAESKLEKRFEGLKKAAEKIIAPVKSLLDKILQFFTTVILGRIVYKLVEWLGDPNNANKVKSIIRFLGDWGPAILGGFILFGTKFGKSIRVLTNIALSGIAKLAKSIPALLRFAKSNPKTALAVAAGGYAATQLAQRAFSGDEQKVEGRAGGGIISTPKFSGGGFNFSGLLGGARNFFNGMVSGEKGVDKIPAWLSDGEFVMSRGAVQKYGVDTLEAMNAAGGGTNKPTFKSESVYAAGGGYMGDYMKDQVKMRPASADEILGRDYKLQDLLGIRNKEEVARLVSGYGNKVPDVRDFLGEKEYSKFQQGHIGRYSDGDDEKIFKGLQRIYQQHFGVGKEFEKMMSNRVDAKMLDRSTTPKPTPQSRFRPGDFRRLSSLQNRFNYNSFRGQSSPLSPDYFLRGQSSPLIRQPIPASRAIVPYTGGALARTGVSVPGGKGGRGGIAGTILTSLAEIFKPQIQAFVGEMYDKMGIGLGNLSDAELKKQLNEQTKRVQKLQSGPMGSFVGGGIETDQLQFLQEEANKRRLSRLKGGAIKGGYGLKQQSFKDMPKTQIMSDDKGKPFVGYKAMRGGKPVYVRGPQPGTGTSNPFEVLGRMINPGAYKDIDAINARKKYEEASKNSISSLTARGATKANIAKRQKELSKRKPVNPPLKPKPKVVVAGGGMNGRRGSGSKPSTSRPPSFSATNNSKPKINILGIRI